MIDSDSGFQDGESCGGRGEICDLLNRNRILEADKQRAAELALQFVRENKHLKQEIDAVKQAVTAEVEKLLEENHGLKSRLGAKEKLEQEYDSELESIQDKLGSEKAAAVQLLEKENQQVQETLRRKISLYEKEVQELRIVREDHRSDIERLNRELEKARRRARLSDDSLASPKINASADALRLELGRITEEKEAFSEQVGDLVNKLKKHRAEKIELEESLRSVLERAENAESMSKEYKTSLDELKAQFSELQLELESVKSTQFNPARKGNSMFAELQLDDHRVKIEAELLTMKRQKLDSEAKCTDLQKEVDRLKRQVATALQLSNAGRASVEELNSLQDELERTRGELRVANARLLKKDFHVPTRTATLPGTGNQTKGGSSFPESSHDSNSLRDLVDQLRRDLETLRNESDRFRLERASCQDELIREQKTRSLIQRELEQAKIDYRRMKIKFEEQIENLQQTGNKQKSDGASRRRREKIPTAVPEKVLPPVMEDSFAGASFLTAADQSSTVVDESTLQAEMEPEEERKGRVKVSPVVVQFSESGTMEKQELKENSKPEHSQKVTRRAKGRKVETTQSVAKPEFDTSVDDCKQQ